MARSSVDPAALSCSVCLEELKEPVTIPCGHSYCSSCINSHWDTEETERKVYSCPQCRHSFSPRPVPYKSIMLAVLVEELKKCGLTADHRYTQKNPLPRCRDDFLRYARDITMDLNTTSKKLMLSDGNRRVTNVGKKQSYPADPDRFEVYQVLSAEELTGRCYWEVEWRGLVRITAAYRDTDRHKWFGNNEKSWALFCYRDGFSFVFNRGWSKISGPVRSRIGVYLDHSAGALSFYSVQGQTMRLLHKVHTQFTRPLHAGVYVGLNSTAHFSKLKETLSQD
ncbi:hypothetical protein WMY93_031286 [Mugilogobius chulae]|uniref:Uncharacterized protein n=1 Tax=Mugilogobius chulae TaxID=88201 RepID=A0AAW0MFY0_9GOBI